MYMQIFIVALFVNKATFTRKIKRKYIYALEYHLAIKETGQICTHMNT